MRGNLEKYTKSAELSSHCMLAYTLQFSVNLNTIKEINTWITQMEVIKQMFKGYRCECPLTNGITRIIRAFVREKKNAIFLIKKYLFLDFPK